MKDKRANEILDLVTKNMKEEFKKICSTIDLYF